MRAAIYTVGAAVLVLGAFVAGRTSAPGARGASQGTTANQAAGQAASSSGPHVLYYVDPMHPAYKADKPGIAPDCGMQLVPVYASPASPGDRDGQAAAGTLAIDQEQQELIGLRTEAATTAGQGELLRVPGRVAADESRIYRINSGVAGWVKETLDGSAGSRVTRQQTLARFYSPEFVALEQGYLVATERMAGGVRQSAAPGTQATAARLRDYGMGEKQIASIGATRQMPENVDIESPVDGFILARNINAGQRFEKNTELYRIADLSHVWIYADVVDGQAQAFHPGAMVTVHLPGDSRPLRARVSQALAQSDGETPSTRVRLEAENPGYRLRPGMFVDVEVERHAPAGVSVPADAVLDSGSAQRVYVDQGGGRFEPRAVTVGEQVGGRVQILRGLAAGERVVVAGNFLLDADSRLKQLDGPKRASAPGAAEPPAGAGASSGAGGRS